MPQRPSRTGKRKLPQPRIARERFGNSGFQLAIPTPVERPPTRGFDRGNLFGEGAGEPQLYQPRPVERPPTSGLDRGNLSGEGTEINHQTLPRAAFYPRKRRKLPKVNPDGTVESIQKQDSDQESGYGDTDVHTNVSTPVTDEGFCQIEVDSPRARTLGFVGTQTDSPVQRYVEAEPEFGAVEGAVGGVGNRSFFREESASSRHSLLSLFNESFTSQDEIVQAVLEADRAMQELVADQRNVNSNTFSFSPRDQLSTHQDLIDWFPTSEGVGTSEPIVPFPVTVVDRDENANCQIPGSSSLTDSAKQALRDQKKMPATTNSKIDAFWGPQMLNKSESTSTPTRDVDGDPVNVMYESDSSSEGMVVRPLDLSTMNHPEPGGIMSPESLWMDDNPANISSQTVRRHTEIIEHEVHTIRTVMEPDTNLKSENGSEALEQSLTEPEPPRILIDSKDLSTQTPRHRTTQTPEDAQTQTIERKSSKRRLPEIPGTKQSVSPDNVSVTSVDDDNTREVGTNPSLLRTIHHQTEGSLRSNYGKTDEEPNNNEGTMSLRATRDISKQPEYITEYQKYIESFDGTGSGPFQPSNYMERESPITMYERNALQNTIRPRHGNPTRTPQTIHISPRNVVNISNQPVPRDNAGQTVVNGGQSYAIQSPSLERMAMNHEQRSSRHSSPRNSMTPRGDRITPSVRESPVMMSPSHTRISAPSPITSEHFDNLFLDVESRPWSRPGSSESRSRDAENRNGSGRYEISPVKTPRKSESPTQTKMNQTKVALDDANIQTAVETKDFGMQTLCHQATQTPLKIKISSRNGSKEPTQTLSVEDGTITVEPTEVEVIELSHNRSFSPYEVLNNNNRSDSSLSSSREFSTQTFGQMAVESQNHAETQTEKMKDTSVKDQVTPVQTPRSSANQHRTPSKSDGSRRKPKDSNRKEKKSHTPRDVTDGFSENLTARSSSSRKNLLRYMLNQVKELKHQINLDATDTETKSPRDRNGRGRIKESDSEDPEKYAKRRLELMYKSPRSRLRRRHSLESLTVDEPGNVARQIGRDRDRYSMRPRFRDDQYYSSRPRSYDDSFSRRAYTPPRRPRYASSSRRLPDVPVRDVPRGMPPPRHECYPPPGPPPPNVFPPHVRPHEPVFIAGPSPPGMIPAGYWGPPPPHPGVPPPQPPPPGMMAPPPNLGQGVFRPIPQGGGQHSQHPLRKIPAHDAPMFVMTTDQNQNHPKPAPYIVISDPMRYESVSDSSGVGTKPKRNDSRRDHSSRSHGKKRSARHDSSIENSLLEADKANRDMKHLTNRMNQKR